MHFSALSHKIDCILVCSAEQMGKKMFSCELHSQCETFEFDDEPHIQYIFSLSHFIMKIMELLIIKTGA